MIYLNINLTNSEKYARDEKIHNMLICGYFSAQPKRLCWGRGPGETKTVSKSVSKRKH
jgi:hypothetical protein